MMKKTVNLKSNSYLLIKGLARFKVISGEIEVFGAKLTSGTEVITPREMQHPIISLSNSSIEIILGTKGEITYINYNPIPKSWREAINYMVDGGVTMVLGDVDVGKSGFTLYAANMLIRKGWKIGIVDTDVGQSDVGPPCTIGLSIIESHKTSYWNLPLYDAYFVGDKTPVGHLLPMVVGTKTMVNKALDTGVNHVLINTTGLVYGGPAIALKRYKAEAVNPSLIVAIQRDGEIEHIIRILENSYRIFRAESPKSIAKKKSKDRILYRKLKFSRYLMDSKTIEIDLNRVKIVNAMYGVKLYDEEIFNKIQKLIGKRPISILHDKKSITIIFSTDISRDEVSMIRTLFSKVYEGVKVTSTLFYRGLILGIYNKKNRFIGLGTLQKIDLTNNKITVKTPIKEFKEISTIHFGYIALDDDNTERMRFQPGRGLI